MLEKFAPLVMQGIHAEINPFPVRMLKIPRCFLSSREWARVFCYGFLPFCLAGKPGLARKILKDGRRDFQSAAGATQPSPGASALG